MAKHRVTHYRPKLPDGHEPIACNATLALRDVQWTEDRADVDCNNCQRTKTYRAA